MNPTRVLLSLLAERLGQTAGRWPRQLFGGAEAPTLREAIAARVEPRLMAPDAGQFGDRPLRVFHGTPEEFSPEGIRALTQSPDGGASGAGQTFYRGVREGDALSGEGPIYLHRDPSKASEYAGARFDASGRPLIETTGEGGNVARVTANIRNPIEVSQQEIAALGYEPYRIREMMQRGYDAAIAPNGEVLVFDRNGVRPAIGRAPDAPNSVSRTDGGASGAGQPRIVRRTLDAPHAPGYGTGTFEILQNPTQSQLDAFMARELRTPVGQQWTREARGGDPRQYYPLRFVRDADGNVYVSSGLAVEHDHMASGLRANGINMGQGMRGAHGSGMMQRRDGQWVYERGSVSTGGDFAETREVYEPVDYYYGRRAPNAPDGGASGAGNAADRFRTNDTPVPVNEGWDTAGSLQQGVDDLAAQRGGWDTMGGRDMGEALIRRHGLDGALEQINRIMADPASRRARQRNGDQGAWEAVQRYIQASVNRRGIGLAPDAPNAGQRGGNGAALAALATLPPGAITLRELLRDHYGTA